MKNKVGGRDRSWEVYTLLYDTEGRKEAKELELKDQRVTVNSLAM